MEEKRQLTTAEWRIMQLLWDKGAMTLRALTDMLSSDTGWSPNAVISFLKRLEVKGVVEIEGERRARKYVPLITRQEAVRCETQELLTRVYRGNMHLMLQNAVESKQLSNEEIDELISILKKGRAGQ